MRLRRDSWEELRPWSPSPERGRSPWGTRWFADFLADARRDDCETLLVCRHEDDRILGVCTLTEVVRGVLQNAFLGYWLGSPHGGQGYMTEGLDLALHHAFVTLGLHRLEANIGPENTRSIALVRRMGFRREGYSPRYLKITGRWRDHERWAILVDDWRAKDRRA